MAASCYKVVVVYRNTLEILELTLGTQGAVRSMMTLRLPSTALAAAVNSFQREPEALQEFKSSVPLYLLTASSLDVWLIPIVPSATHVCEGTNVWNQFVGRTQPWRLTIDLARLDGCKNVRASTISTIFNLYQGVSATPFMANQSSQRLWQQLGFRLHRPALVSRELFSNVQFGRCV